MPPGNVGLGGEACEEANGDSDLVKNNFQAWSTGKVASLSVMQFLHTLYKMHPIEYYRMHLEKCL